MRPFLFILLALTLTACPQKEEPISCTEVFVSGLVIKVTDAASNEIISEGITIIAEDGDYNETLVFSFDSYIGAGERAGTYIVTISGDGYVTKTLEPIEVLADECHVIPQEIDVQLMPN